VKYRQLGRSGLRVSEIGLGCNNFGKRLSQEDSAQVIHGAIENGITLFDTADIYGNRGGSEEIIGKTLGSHRDEIVLATKFGMDMGDAWDVARGSRRYLTRALEASLRRLRTDHIDLYQLHQPDPYTPIEETLRALDDAVRAGKILYVGSSNFTGWQIAQAEYVARGAGVTGFVSTQPEYSILRRGAEAEIIPASREFGVGVLPFFPLASGLLTGKYRRGEAAPSGARLAGQEDQFQTSDFDVIERLSAWGEAHGYELIDLAFGYLLGEQAVSSVIAGATSVEQVKRNVATLERPQIDPEELRGLL